MITIQFVDELSSAVEKAMRKDLVNDDTSHGIDVNYKRFALILNTEDEEIIGVLNAYTAFAEIYIDDMWVDSNHRGKGYGTKLINALEQHFEGKGFNNINLCTSAFTGAADFYKKCGFTLEFIRENTYNPQLTKFFFVKFFKNQAQHQGIIQSDLKDTDRGKMV